jgi:TctA family transporter
MERSSLVRFLLSREEALRVAQASAETGVLAGIIVIILLVFLGLWLVSIGEYLYAACFFALILLAIWSIRRARRFAKIYEQERMRAAAESS